MKLITLNIWGGRVTKPLFDFFKENSGADIFCLQEVYNGITKPVVQDRGDQFNIYNDIKKLLPNHNSYFRASIPGYGLAIFVSKNIEVKKEGDMSIYEVSNYVSGGNHSRNLQYIQIRQNREYLTIVNVHGLWNGNGKSDTEHRLEQSRRIKKFTNSIKEGVILCGDFNLSPDTESIKILEENMRNLIKEYGIISTRTSLYEKENKFADYVFINDNINLVNFEVLPHEVSDHSPVMLEFK